MAGLQRLPHHLGVAGAVERVVGAPDLVDAALGEIDQIRHQIALDFGRVYEMRHAEALAPGFLGRIEIDPDDHVGAGKAQSLNDIEPDAAQTEDDSGRPDLNLGGVDHSADAGGDAATDIEDFVEWRLGIDLGDGNLG